MKLPQSTLVVAVLVLALCSAPSPVVAQKSEGSSTATIGAALIMNTIIAAVEIVAFLLLRTRIPKVYAPRTYLGPPGKRLQPLSNSSLGWIIQLIRTPDTVILEKNGLDAYMFVKYLDMMCWIFVPLWALTWIILLPAYGAKSGGTNTGFDLFTLANVGKSRQQQKRYAAALLVQWIATLWILYIIQSHVNRFVKLRHDFLMSSEHSKTPQAKSILITGVPDDFLCEKKLAALYSLMPGGVAKVWVNRNLKNLPDLCSERKQLCNRLEKAECELIRLAHRRVQKGKVRDIRMESDAEIPLDVADHYVARKERPTHKLGIVPFIGKRVDTIEWCREEIVRLNKLIEEKRHEIQVDSHKYPPQNSAFILFHDQIAAHMAVKTHAHNLPYRMAERYVEAHPSDIVWSNLNMNPYEKKLRSSIGWTITIGTVAFWFVPVAFIGVLSNVKGLADKISFLHWLNSLPSVLIGVIQGILPPVLLSMLNMFLPIFLRIVAHLSGIPTRTGIELSLQDRFFLFQIVQNFLAITIISGASSGITELVNAVKGDISKFPSLLATKIPGGSSFFLSFIALQGLSGGAALFLQATGVLWYIIRKYLLRSTTRKIWQIENNMSSVAWGTLFPSVELITVIATGYMVIAPITNGFASVTFIIFYVGYRYRFLYVFQQKAANETSGLFFTNAINHIFTGLYVEMVMLCALFFLAQSDDGLTKRQSAIPEGVLMVFLIILVFAFHHVLNDSYKSLYTALPLVLIPPNVPDAPNTDIGPTYGSAASESSIEKMPVREPQRMDSQKTMAENGDPELMTSKDINDADRSQSSSSESSKNVSNEISKANHKAFNHPSLSQDQTPIWVPNDRFGIGRASVASARNAGLLATDLYAEINEKGTITTHCIVPPGGRLSGLLVNEHDKFDEKGATVTEFMTDGSSLISF